MTSQDLELIRDREARKHCEAAEQGRIGATLEDGCDWERLGLGRVFFVGGVPTWHPGPRGAYTGAGE